MTENNERNELKKELDPYELSKDIIFGEDGLSYKTKYDDKCADDLIGDTQIKNHDDLSEENEESEETVGIPESEAEAEETGEISESEAEVQAQETDEPSKDEAGIELSSKAEVVNTSDIYFEELKKIIDEHFAAVKGLIRYSKEKDNNVLTLSKQLQMYRDGVENTLFKSIAMEIIGYREECRKSLRVYEKHQPSASDAIKYINYLKLDFEDVLENLGIECADGNVYYNKKNINDELSNAEFKEVPEINEIELNDISGSSPEDITKYLEDCEKAISKMIQNNFVLDSVIQDYILLASVYEKGLYQVILYPIIRLIVKVYNDLCERISYETISEENAVTFYQEQLLYIVQELEKILERCNVNIDSYVSDTYDPKKHRIIKILETEDAELNGHVVCRYTDCYMMEDKVIYLSQVEVYKAKIN